MMTAKQTSLVKSSWRLLRDLDPQQLGDLFYSKLFLDHPELRSLFPKDLNSQNQKLMATLQVLITRLDQMKTLEQELAGLAKRHMKYGARPRHYHYVGSALLWTFERILGDDWTPPVAEAWANLYNTLVSTMLQTGLNQDN